MIRLNEHQLAQIDDFLDRKELVFLDLRDEIADHIVEGILNLMRDQNVEFDDAFVVETKKWHKDLNSYSSYWLGLLWTGPRIVIEKCVKQIKIIYLKAFLVAITILGIFYLINNFFALNSMTVLNTVIGIIYIMIFIALFFLKFKIKNTGYQTSFSFLFKINAIAFGFLYILYNPIFTDIFGLVSKGSFSYVSLFMHAFTLTFSCFFFDFYKSHMLIKNLRLA